MPAHLLHKACKMPRMLELFFLLAVCARWNASYSTNATLSSAEYDVLQDFYASTTGPEWYYNDDEVHWNFVSDSDPCMDQWVGITCILPYPYDVYHVQGIALNYHNLVGTLPPSLNKLLNLTTLDVSQNLLSDTIPILNHLTSLQELNLGDNLFTGSLPSFLAQLASLTVLDVSYNGLDGEVTQAFNSAVQTQVKVLDLSNNGFGGTLSESLFSAGLQKLALGGNAFTGTLPSIIAQLSSLSSLDVSNNNLYGGVNQAFNSTKRAALSYADLSQNAFTGTIADGIFPATLQDLRLFSNLLSGSLPASLAQLSSLSYLDVGYNLLRGNVQQVFNATVQTELRAVYLPGNSFSGTLPESAFGPNLTSFDGSENCFHGTLPAAICHATQLQQLYLYCLGCSDACTYRPLLRSSFIMLNPVHGTIPACLFTLSGLEDLDLSQNLLSGRIPANGSVLNLYGAFLNNNILTGSIPDWIQKAIALEVEFDMGYNRLHGEITSSVTEFSSADVTYNRLSGRPFGANWPATANVDLLEGNLFSCKPDKSDLFQGDPELDLYKCGSDNFNQPIYTWVAVMGALLLAAAAVVHWKERIEPYLGLSYVWHHLGKWESATRAQSAELPALFHVVAVAASLRRVGVACAVLAVCVLSPLYAILTAYYGTYRHQFAWTVSSVLLSGRAPFALCFVCFLCTVGAAVWWLHRSNQTDTEAAPQRSIRKIAAITLFLLINVCVVGMVNVSFVAVSRYASAKYQLGISAFKVVWNLLVVPFLSRTLAYELSAARADWITLELCLSLLCNVGIPLLAVLFTSELCLFPLYGTTVDKAVYFAFKTYTGFYDYPFYYSYQCSYVYLNYYAAAYVYMCLMTTFGTPLIELTMQQLHRRARPGTYWFLLLDTVLPRILKPVETDPALVPARSLMKPYFDTTQFIVTQFTYLAMILTLGLVFPPLAATLAVCMVATSVYATLKVGRVLVNAREVGNGKYAELIEQECAGVTTAVTLSRALWLVLWFCALFYPLFLFDTLGDAVGFNGAYWILIVVPLLPLLLLPFELSVRGVSADRGGKLLEKETRETNVEDGVELTATVSPLSRLL